MRAVLLITGANVMAFALGMVVAVWALVPRTTPAIAVAAAPPMVAAATVQTLASHPAAVEPPQPPAPVAAIPTPQTAPPDLPAAELGRAASGPKAAMPERTVAAREKAAAEPARTPDAGTGGYGIQLGAFSNPDHAALRRALLAKQGFGAQIVPLGSPSAGLLSVQLRGFADRAAAAQAAASVQRETGIVGLVMRTPS